MSEILFHGLNLVMMIFTMVALVHKAVLGSFLYRHNADLLFIVFFVGMFFPLALLFFFFFNDPAPPKIYPLPLHAPLPIKNPPGRPKRQPRVTRVTAPPGGGG